MEPLIRSVVMVIVLKSEQKNGYNTAGNSSVFGLNCRENIRRPSAPPTNPIPRLTSVKKDRLQILNERGWHSLSVQVRKIDSRKTLSRQFFRLTTPAPLCPAFSLHPCQSLSWQ
ncbi:hypothetical protein BaRGS_00009262 [Batillaria attramentaria]|uniref:Uncharacterized protein n=1 Tax=Batillaria attramentaria TaxID=370345 RepID=A0ABD0LJA8_9CAEN